MAQNNDFIVKNGLTVKTTATIQSTLASTSTTTGALVVSGGAGIGGRLYANELYINNLRADATTSATTWGIFYNTTTKELTTSTAGTAVNNNLTTIGTNTNASFYPTFVDSNNTSTSSESFYTTSSFVINPNTGNIGIGTTPSYKLDVYNNGGATPPAYIARFNSVSSTFGTTNESNAVLLINGANGSNNRTVSIGIGVPSTYGGHDVGFISLGTSSMWNDTNGTWKWSTSGATTNQGVTYKGYEWYNNVSDNQNAFTFYHALTSGSGSTFKIYSAKTANTSTRVLEVTSALGANFSVDNAGNVGIGTNSPVSKLQVVGDARISGITTVTNITNSVSTVTGALQVVGGAGIGGDLYAARLGFTSSNITAVDLDTPVSLTRSQTSGTYWIAFYGSNQTATMAAQSCAFDSVGNAYMWGGNEDNGIESFLVKYDPYGAIIWQKKFVLGTNYKGAETVIVDSSDNVYISMTDNNSFVSPYKIYLVKLDSSGNILWQQAITSLPSFVGIGYHAIDSGNNLLISFFDGNSTQHVVKFNPSGSILLQKSITGAGRIINVQTGYTNQYGAGLGIGVDSSDNIYAGERYLTKFSSTGTVQWQVAAGGGYSNAVDPSGNVYIPTQYNQIRKLDTNGNPLWQLTVNAPVTSGSGPGAAFNFYGIHIGDDGYIYASAHSKDNTIVFFKLNSSGAVIWQRELSTAPDVEEEGIYWWSASNIKVKNGRLIWTGHSYYDPVTGTSNNYTGKSYKTVAVMISLPTDGSLIGKYSNHTYTPATYSTSLGTFTVSAGGQTVSDTTLSIGTVSLTVTTNTNAVYTTSLKPTSTYQWKFAENGNLIFPDGTAQSSAFVENGDYSFGDLNVQNLKLHSKYVALGAWAGGSNPGDYSVAIGFNAGDGSTLSNTIIISAQQTVLDAKQSNALYIAPIRADATTSATTWNLYYNAATKEITTASVLSVGLTTIAQSGNATYYPTFVDSNNITATNESFYTTSSFNINAQTGVVSIASTVETTSTTTGALLVSGGIRAAGSVYVGNNLYIGNGSTALTLTAPTMVAVDSGSSYAQAAIQNRTATGSADWVAYPDNGTDANGWADMGMAGSTFNDPAYTITGPNDGYFFVSAVPASGKTGNLVLATSGNGTTNDIVFGTGGFLSANEKMRFVNATGQLDIKTLTTATSTSTGALRVRGGAGIAGDLYVGGNIYFNGTAIAPAKIQEFTATQNQSVFTVTNGYTVGTVQVFANGIAFGSSDFTASDGSTISLTTSRNSGDIIRVVAGTSLISPNNVNVSSLTSNSLITSGILSTSSNTVLGTSVDTIFASSALTLTLPDAVANIGRRYRIKSLTTGQVNIVPQSGQSIDGDTTGIIISFKYNMAELVSDGSNWYIF